MPFAWSSALPIVLAATVVLAESMTSGFTAAKAIAPLKKVEDARLAYALSAGQIMVERTGPLASTIRLIAVPDRGECDGDPETCPQVHLYVGVVELEDPAGFSLFDLGRAFGWEATTWRTETTLPQDDCEFRLYQPIVLRRKVLSPTAGETWRFEEFEVLVNPMCGRARATVETPQRK